MADTLSFKNVSASDVIVETLGGITIQSNGGSVLVVPDLLPESRLFDIYPDELKGYVTAGSLTLIVDGVEYTSSAKIHEWLDPASFEEASVDVYPYTSNDTLTIKQDGGLIACSNQITISLPAVTIRKGLKYIIKNVGTDDVNLSPNGTDTIDGENANQDLFEAEGLTLVSDGVSNWSVY